MLAMLAYLESACAAAGMPFRVILTTGWPVVGHNTTYLHSRTFAPSIVSTWASNI